MSRIEILARPAPGRSLPAAIAPGVLLCAALAQASALLAHIQIRIFGHAWLEPLVIAILLGAFVRSNWAPGAVWLPGIRFSARTLLEIAVVLLGANVSAHMIAQAGQTLLLGIAAVVFLSLLSGYALGRAFGLPRKMCVLIACGNSICGNSAIATVAPIIDARSDDVAGAIAFTAVLGVAVVLGLPPLARLLDLQPTGFGVLAGLTVYAVPQVLAATAPVSSVSAQVGTLVKLVRVLMLGPLVLLLSIVTARHRNAAAHATTDRAARTPRIAELVPWFILGFIAMVALRSFDVLPGMMLAPLGHASSGLTVTSMAALGLGVDVRQLARAGARVSIVVVLSLAALGAISLVLIHLLGLDRP